MDETDKNTAVNRVAPWCTVVKNNENIQFIKKLKKRKRPEVEVTK